MNTQQLESFVQVAETLSFAQAAQLLNITQSAVSRQIHSLEEELDTKLFYRTTRTVVLTSEGIMFLEHAKRVLEQLRAAAAKLRHHTNARIQPLTIGSESETDLDLLGGTLLACREQIMAFHPVLKILPYSSLLNQFFQGEIDLLFGLQENLPIRQEMAYTALGELPLCCALPASHPLAARACIDEADLFSQQLILCTAYTFPKKALEIQTRIAQHISPERILTCDHPSGIRTLIRTGYGCAILPRAIRRDPELAFVPLSGTPPLSYGIAYHKNSSNGVLRNFVDTAVNLTAAQAFPPVQEADRGPL